MLVAHRGDVHGALSTGQEPLVFISIVSPASSGFEPVSFNMSEMPHRRNPRLPPLILSATHEMKTPMTILFLLALITLSLFLDVYQIGFAMGGACDFGFGVRLQAFQEKSTRDYILVKLLSFIHLDNVACGGFADPTVVANLRVSHGKVDQPVAELEATFFSPQNLPLFDVRTASVSIPKDRNAPSTVRFNGTNF